MFVFVNLLPWYHKTCWPVVNSIILFFFLISSPAHYVTPFDTGATQVITQPITTTQQVAAHVVASTGGYDFSQAQALYTQQVMAGAGTDHGQTHGLSPTTRACPQTVSIIIYYYII